MHLETCPIHKAPSDTWHHPPIHPHPSAVHHLNEEFIFIHRVCECAVQAEMAHNFHLVALSRENICSTFMYALANIKQHLFTAPPPPS